MFPNPEYAGTWPGWETDGVWETDERNVQDLGGETGWDRENSHGESGVITTSMSPICLPQTNSF